MKRVAYILLHNLPCYGRLVIEMRIAVTCTLISNTNAICSMGETPWKPTNQKRSGEP